MEFTLDDLQRVSACSSPPSRTVMVRQAIRAGGPSIQGIGVVFHDGLYAGNHDR